MSSGSSRADSAVEPDQIHEHHRQLPPFGLGTLRDELRTRRRRRGRRRCKGAVLLRQPAQSRDGVQQFPSVTNDPDAQVVQIVGGQRRQQLGVNRMLAERLLVALQPQLSQPCRDLHDVPRAVAVAPRTLAE